MAAEPRRKDEQPEQSLHCSLRLTHFYSRKHSHSVLSLLSKFLFLFLILWDVFYDRRFTNSTTKSTSVAMRRNQGAALSMTDSALTDTVQCCSRYHCILMLFFRGWPERMVSLMAEKSREHQEKWCVCVLGQVFENKMKREREKKKRKIKVIGLVSATEILQDFSRTNSNSQLRELFQEMVRPHSLKIVFCSCKTATRRKEKK